MPMIRLWLVVAAALLLAGCTAIGCGADGGNRGYEADCSAEIRF